MNSQRNDYDILVIGGGAAGMMAAAVASGNGRRVAIIEKNGSLGEKLKITGGGRCNITNAEFDVRTLLAHCGQAKKFLFSPFSQFGVRDTFDFFTSRNLPLIVQANNRAFPHTQKATDVYKTLLTILNTHHVKILAGQTVKKLNYTADKITSVTTSIGELKARSYILATGGVSHPETGSTGDGFRWLKALGHTVKAPTPTIVPLAVKEKWIKILAGKTFTNIKITFYLDSKKQFNKHGNILCTHFGISGPLILNSAAAVAALLQNGEVTAFIDIYPNKDLGTLEREIIHIFDTNKNKLLKNVFREIAPPGTVKAFQLLLATIDFEKNVHSVTKEERKQIVHMLKASPLTIIHLMGADRAVSADGGVILEEIDVRTMRSKLFPNLYIIGDLLHINRPSGGYSLQLCWTTGYIAAKNA